MGRENNNVGAIRKTVVFGRDGYKVLQQELYLVPFSSLPRPSGAPLVHSPG